MWFWAVTWAIQARNFLPRLGPTGDWNSPHVAYHGTKPDLTGLRAFGADVWLHVQQGARHMGKLGCDQEPGRLGVLIGYDLQTRLYAVMTADGSIHRSRTCTFDEQPVIDRMLARGTDNLRVPDTNDDPLQASSGGNPGSGGDPDSNHGPVDPQSNASPLDHAPTSLNQDTRGRPGPAGSGLGRMPDPQDKGTIPIEIDLESG